MCFDELDTVESMRGYTMLCFMYPTVTGDGYSWIMRAHRYVIHVSKYYCWWWLTWIQLDNESTSVCCVSCGQVLLVVVLDTVGQ